MNRADRKFWIRIVKSEGDRQKLASYKQQIRDAIQEFNV